MKFIFLSLFVSSIFAVDFGFYHKGEPYDCGALDMVKPYTLCFKGDVHELVIYMNKLNCDWGDGAFYSAIAENENLISYIHHHLGDDEPREYVVKCN